MVYKAGAEFWEEPIATEALVRLLHEFDPTKRLKAVDMGCGEGRDSIFLAKEGFDVTAIDASPSAIMRAHNWVKDEGLVIDFIVADVTNLPIKDEIYHFAINAGCLHMIIDQRARDKHLREAYRALKREGIYFSCNLGVDESTSFEDFYRKTGKKPGELVKRKIRVQGEEKEIYLPIIAAWPKSREQYLEEFQNAGFNILKAYKETTKPIGSCWIIIAVK